MYNVFIEGLEFYGYHGVPAEERAVGHRYIADLWLSVEGRADVSDHIADTVDYAAVGQEVMSAIASAKAHTLEHLAHETCGFILERFPSVASVRLKLSKPYPPTPMIAAKAGVEVVLARS